LAIRRTATLDGLSAISRPPEATRGADQAERTLKQSREAMHSWLKPDRWFSVGFAILANPSLAERGWITTVART